MVAISATEEIGVLLWIQTLIRSSRLPKTLKKTTNTPSLTANKTSPISSVILGQKRRTRIWIKNRKKKTRMRKRSKRRGPALSRRASFWNTMGKRRMGCFSSIRSRLTRPNQIRPSGAFSSFSMMYPLKGKVLCFLADNLRFYLAEMIASVILR